MAEEAPTPKPKEPIYTNIYRSPEENRKFCQWVRENQEYHGLDGSKFIFGYMLHELVDDGNAFSWIGLTAFEQDTAIKSFAYLQDRIEWEMGVLELPAEVKERLKKFQAHMLKTNPADEQEFRKLHKIWKNKIYEFLHKKIDKEEDKKYFNASSYYLKHKHAVRLSRNQSKENETN